MMTTKTSIRVRYAETDQMGFVYYGNYAQYFEVARVEMLREWGLSYKQLEESGVLLPVLEYNIRYFKPAIYDDVLLVETRIEKMPSARIRFDYKTFNEAGELLNEAFTTLVFVDSESKKPRRAPEKMVKYFDAHFPD